MKDYDAYGTPLIRYAIDQKYDASTFLALLEANVSPAKARDQNGRSLVERVIESQYSSEVILKVIQANPEAAKIDFERANLQVPVFFTLFKVSAWERLFLRFSMLIQLPLNAKYL